MIVGVLALQGDFEAHGEVLRRLGATVSEVRTTEELRRADALVLPGGESTTMRKLMEGTGLEEALAEDVRAGKPVFATCAGAILLSREIQNPDGRGLGLLEADVIRNAYGRQLESRIVRLDFVREDLLGIEPLEGVFIRAPRLVSLSQRVEVLACRGEDPVLVRQGTILAATFHPELTRSDRVHDYFLRSCKGADNPDRARIYDARDAGHAAEQVTFGTEGKRNE